MRDTVGGINMPALQELDDLVCDAQEMEFVEKFDTIDTIEGLFQVNENLYTPTN